MRAPIPTRLWICTAAALALLSFSIWKSTGGYVNWSGFIPLGMVAAALLILYFIEKLRK